MTLCHRCGLQLSAQEPRTVMDGHVYHLYCKWKLEQQAIRRIPDRLINLGDDHDDTLHKGRGSNPDVPER